MSSETFELAPYVVSPEKIAFYRAHGWVVLEDVVSAAEVSRIKGIAEDMVSGRIDTRRNRADLGAHADRTVSDVENIIQIAWPTDLTSALEENELIQRARAVSEALYGSAPGSWALDMNQFLIKRERTLTDTPLHQDQSYYIPLRDARAVNLWLALVDVTEEMGCLWFEDSPIDAPARLREHRAAGRGGGALTCGEPDFARMTPCPLRAGSVTVHSALTPHYAKGNASEKDCR
jgi:ectoine hydroxylase-related dioxygenase (phytanoyl-CoA dioxygenase family)